MKFVRDLYNLPADHTGCVASIGNFDGVHRGHRSIIEQLQAAARRLNLPMVIISFEPHPQEYFAPTEAPARLMRLREKIGCLQQLDVDLLLCLRFDEKLASQSPEEFVRQTLVEKLGVRYLVVGADFRFGYRRRGNIDTLRELGSRFGYEVVTADTCMQGGSRVSSSRVRMALAEGDLQEARTLLGRPYCISGRIVHGSKRGRELGFPTININMHRLKSPVHGIFASRVHGLQEEPLAAVSSIGTRPVFAGREVNLETHILDYTHEAYGRHAQVEFCKRLREEKNFASVAELQAQIKKDVAAARDYFATDNDNNMKRSGNE